MKHTILVLLAISLFFSCSSDDESNNVPTPDSINQTEWEHEESDRGYYIYFSVGNDMRISHPFYDVGSEEFYNEDIEGEFIYDKPNVILNFFGQCNNSGFVFSSCNVTGTINGSTLTINDNGTNYTFENMYPNE
ncbi:hypothetical protein [Winogradskyella forsetii]|uniref:hypothetical protein n=1 Tax=Winogradskyella forsetii TaxID=2686077 RepID=UPI0015B949CA|nr:hypothetical protein [Winogradskyella forsetii]